MTSLSLLFTIPKAFRGLDEIHQRNAIESWLALGEDWRILLLGDEDGVREISIEYGVDHVPRVEKNEYGTPLISSAFRLAAVQSKDNPLCYVNADILLPPELTAALHLVRRSRFVMVCRRREVDVSSRLDFGQQEKAATFARLAAEAGSETRPTAIDLFMFPNRPELVAMPPFAVGRQGWDNWFLYNAWRHRVPIIDASPYTTIYHQRHTYQHVSARHADAKAWGGPEGDRNVALAGGFSCLFDIRDATHLLTRHGPRFARTGEYLNRRVERMRKHRPILFRMLRFWKARYAACYYVPWL